jgi:voltage-gated potassium channel
MANSEKAPRGPLTDDTVPGDSPLRSKIHDIIFEAEDTAGRLFDIVLLVLICLSVLAVILESVPSIAQNHQRLLVIAEWVFTILFTIEYGLRLWCVHRPVKYATSFFGVVDLLSIAPTWLSLFFPAGRAFGVIRAFRLLRVFRIFKAVRYVGEFNTLILAIRRTRAKITVFLFALLVIVLIMGTAMYVIEGPEHGFDSIPNSLYWAIVTVTTVGYGDLAPETTLGRAIAALAMVLGYSLIIIPTGIFAVEMAQANQPVSNRSCRSCAREGQAADALFCKYCGEKLGTD